MDAFKRLQLGGSILEVAEKEFSASFGGTDGEAYIDNLITRYDDAGSPSNFKTWCKGQMAGDFRCVGEKPVWRNVPMWQWHNNLPMLFVSQSDITEAYKEIAGWGYSVYTFVSRAELEEGGWESVVKTVTQSYE